MKVQHKASFALLSLSAALLVACSNNQTPAPASEAPATEPAPKPLHIKIATESNFKPFSYTDNNGNLVGFEIDLANALCEQMQATCEISSQDWDGLIPGLNAKRFDAIMAGMSITPERSEIVQFSDPYFYNTLVLIAQKGKDITIDTLDGKTVATQRATVSAQYLAENYPNAVLKLYDTQDNAYLDLQAQRAEAMLSNKAPVMDWLTTDAGSGYEIKGAEIDVNGEIAIALRKGDDLVTKFNTALSELRASGEYDTIAAKYFGTNSTAAANAPKTLNEAVSSAAASVVGNVQAAGDQVEQAAQETMQEIQDSTSAAEPQPAN